ncbi:MAG: hypothetical protein QG555_1617 [Thermodesulfobacteriota bacterium]|nr:hypothetical protein [Thermodesulfobacteriota bacterium]
MEVRQTNSAQKRLSILGEDEIEALYSRPRFTPEERRLYFSLSQPEKELLQELRSVKSRAYFVLQLGYFKARHLFFVFDFHQVEADLQYVLEQHFDPRPIADRSAVDKHTRLKQQHLILELFHYRSCDAQERRQLEAKAGQAAMVCGQPIYVFRELMHYLEEQRIVAPGYSFIQDTVGAALTHEQNRVVTIVRHHLKPADQEALKELLEDSPGLYEITQLKREPKDFSAREIKHELHRGEQIQPLYRLGQRLLPALNISNESIKYYASLVGYYSVYKLKRLNRWMVYVSLLCFIYHRYQRLHDNLINSLLYNVRGYVDEAKAAAKERGYAYRIESDQNLQKAGQVLKLFTDDRIAEDTPFQEVRALAFALLERRKLALIADHITTNARFDETVFQWDHVDTLALQFKRHLRPILRGVDLAASLPHDPLMEAVHFLKAAFGKGSSLGQQASDTFPIRFIPDTTKRYLYAPDPAGPKHLLVDRYEFLVYRLLRNGLEAGDLFCRDSVRFRSFEDDLLDDQQWQHKQQLIADTGLVLLKQPIQDHLAKLEQRLEDRLASVRDIFLGGLGELDRVLYLIQDVLAISLIIILMSQRGRITGEICP